MMLARGQNSSSSQAAEAAASMTHRMHARAFAPRY